MEFCEHCRNMLFEVDKDNIFYLECKNCDIAVPIGTNTSRLLSEKDYNKRNIIFNKYIREYNDNGIPTNNDLRYDPTLPTIINTNIKAPSNYKHIPGEPVKYIQGDTPNKETIYLSIVTGEIWMKA